MPKIIKLSPQKELPVIGVKILENEYANSFVNEGVVHFSSPDTWKDETTKSGLQLDKYEGCFCYSISENDEAINQLGRHYTRIEEGSTYRYFEKNSSLMACCFYGVNRSDFTCRKMSYGVEEIDSYQVSVNRNYFDRFNKNDNNTKSAVIIFDLQSLTQRITSKLVEMGCKREDIIAFPVYYVNKTVPFLSNEPFPFEYFLKDIKFKEQSEYRILLKSKDKVFLDRFKSEGNNVMLGDISAIARVHDYYRSDLDFAIQGDKLIYSLPTPIKTHISEMPFAEVVGILYQTLQNRLPGNPISREEIDAYVGTISDVLMRRFGVKYCDDSRLENVPYTLFKDLPVLYQGMCRNIVYDVWEEYEKKC